MYPVEAGRNWIHGGGDGVVGGDYVLLELRAWCGVGCWDVVGIVRLELWNEMGD